MRLLSRGGEELYGDGAAAAEVAESSSRECECTAKCLPVSRSRIFDGVSQGRGSAERRGGGAPLADRVGVWTI